MTNNHERMTESLESQNKKLENEIKVLNSKFQVDNFSKLGHKLLTEKKISELLENEKKLQTEIE